MKENSFLPGLFRSLDYVRGFVASQVLFEFIKEDIASMLERGLSTSEIAIQKGYQLELLEAFFEYLAIEQVLEKRSAEDGSTQFKLSPYGSDLEKYKGWILMLVGGYGPVFSNIGQILRQGSQVAKRDGRWVGVGSCLISRYDTIPLTKLFMERVNQDPKLIVDFGCGNALYLCTFCESMPGVRAIGIEPCTEAFEAGLSIIREKGLSGRIQLANCDALEYNIREKPDFILFGFVLHELYYQIGEQHLIAYLQKLRIKFPDTHLIVMEVDYDIDNSEVMQSAMGLGYYNPYYLLHPFTRQKLLPKQHWHNIFAAAGLKLMHFDKVDPDVDPTGLGIGFLLET